MMGPRARKWDTGEQRRALGGQNGATATETQLNDPQMDAKANRVPLRALVRLVASPGDQYPCSPGAEPAPGAASVSDSVQAALKGSHTDRLLHALGQRSQHGLSGSNTASAEPARALGRIAKLMSVHQGKP